MIRFAAAFALILATAAPAAAQSACEAPRGQSYVVRGVAAGDVLNLRSRPGDGRVVAAVPPGGGVTATGEVRFTREECAIGCAGLPGGAAALKVIVEANCLAKGRIWYRVTTAKGATGWAAAQFLRPGKPTAPPPVTEAPAEGTFRFVCQNGDRIVVTVPRGAREAEVVTVEGTFFYLARKAGGPPISYASSSFGGMSLSGTPARVVWKAPGTRETTCVERP